MNQPEPELKGPSVTIKATEDRIQQMQREADQVWPPELAQLMKVSTTSVSHLQAEQCKTRNIQSAMLQLL